MAAKKLPEPESTSTPENASDWFRQFLKHLELEIADGGRELQADPGILECGLIALQAVYRTLLDSGLDEQQVAALFGRAVSKKLGGHGGMPWTAELNQRRFELIDREIQGTLGPTEELELAALTQLMREHVDSEHNLPLEGAKKLHRYLVEGGNDSPGLVP
jgi:hypothetical protein